MTDTTKPTEDTSKDKPTGLVSASGARRIATSDVSKGVDRSAHKADDDLYVPVVNVNYYPEGVVELQGFVPDHPGNDRFLLGIKTGLEAQGEVSGTEVEGPTSEAIEESEKTPEVVPVGPDAPVVADKTDDKVPPSKPSESESTSKTSRVSVK